MKNYVQKGDNISVTADADIASGEMVLKGALFGVASGAVKAGETVTLVRKGVFTGPKATGQSWSVGAKIYWDDTAKKLTTTATSNKLVGCVVLAAGSSDATGTVLLDGVIR